MRKYLVAGVKLLARALGISERAARRRAATMPGAQKVGGAWHVPVDTETYARGAGVSRRTAQRRGVSAASPVDPAIQSQIPTGLPTRGFLRYVAVDPKRMIAPVIRPFQHQGYAWIRFLASGDIARRFSSTILTVSRQTVSGFRKLVKADLDARFSSSPYEIISIGVVYAWEAR